MARLSREEKRLITRKKMRYTALKEFALHGFAGAAIERISESAGFSRGAFYANYQNKEDILLDLLKENHQQNMAEWQSYINDSSSINDVYKKMAENLSDYLLDTDWGLFNIEVLLKAKRDDAFASQYLIYLEEAHKNIEKSLLAMFLKAHKQPPENIQIITQIIHNLVIGLILDTKSDQSPTSLNRSSEQFIFCIKNFIVAAPPLK